MELWKCTICGHVYNEDKEGTTFDDLPGDWVCPVCSARKGLFKRKE